MSIFNSYACQGAQHLIEAMSSWCRGGTEESNTNDIWPLVKRSSGDSLADQQTI